MKNNKKTRYWEHLQDDYWGIADCLERTYFIPEKLRDIMTGKSYCLEGAKLVNAGRIKHFVMFSHEALAVIAYIKSGATDDVLTQYILDNMHLYIEFFTGNGMTEETALLLQWKKENGNFESVDDIDRKFEI